MDFDVEKTLLAHSTSGCVIDEAADPLLAARAGAAGRLRVMAALTRRARCPASSEGVSAGGSPQSWQVSVRS